MPKMTPVTVDSTLLDTLTPVQAGVLKSLVAGSSISAAAKQAGRHRSTVHLWTRNHQAFCRALLAARQDRAEMLLDELSDLSQLACDTFRQLLSDPNTPAATRLKAAMEIVTRPKSTAHRVSETQNNLQTDRVFEELHLATVANTPIPEPPQPTVVTEKIEKQRCATRPALAAAASSTNAVAVIRRLNRKPAPPEARLRRDATFIVGGSREVSREIDDDLTTTMQPNKLHHLQIIFPKTNLAISLTSKANTAGGNPRNPKKTHETQSRHSGRMLDGN